MKIENSVVFVTGASRGLGLAFAREALARGASKVYAGVRNPAAFSEPGIVPIALDVTDPASVEGAARAAMDVTILVNNAGIAKITGSPIAENAEDHARRIGAIINNASMGSFIGFQNLAPYIASKHAVLGLTRTAALEYFPRGIRINAVCPGIIDTPFQDRLWGTNKPSGISPRARCRAAPEPVKKSPTWCSSWRPTAPLSSADKAS